MKGLDTKGLELIKIGIEVEGKLTRLNSRSSTSTAVVNLFGEAFAKVPTRKERRALLAS